MDILGCYVWFDLQIEKSILEKGIVFSIELGGSVNNSDDKSNARNLKCPPCVIFSFSVITICCIWFLPTFSILSVPFISRPIPLSSFDFDFVFPDHQLELKSIQIQMWPRQFELSLDFISERTSPIPDIPVANLNELKYLWRRWFSASPSPPSLFLKILS